MILSIGSKVTDTYFRIVQASQVKRGFTLAYTFDFERNERLITEYSWLTFHFIYLNGEKRIF